MADLPKSIKIGPFTFMVNIDQERLESFGRETNTEISGLFEFSEQRITLSEIPGKDFEKDTVLHEVLHACLAITVCELKPNIEERVVSSLSGIILDTLQRNPDLVRYLLD